MDNIKWNNILILGAPDKEVREKKQQKSYLKK